MKPLSIYLITLLVTQVKPQYQIIMKQTIVTFETPDVQVQFSNIKMDFKKRTFELTLGIKEPNQRKFRQEQVEGSISPELIGWLTRLSPVKIPVLNDEGDTVWTPTGAKATGFQKYCTKNGIPFGQGILTKLVFTSNNTSDNYVENPFRLVKLSDRNILTLVNVPSRQKKEYHNPTTGETTTYYKVKRGTIDGRSVKAFIGKNKYRRLVVQSTKEVEVAQ